MPAIPLLSFLMKKGKANDERAAFSEMALHRNPATVSVDNLRTHSQPDTGAAPTTRSDTAAAVVAPATPQRPDTTAQNRPSQAATEFRDGARAPDTATSLPSFAVVGGAMVLAGVALRRRRRRVPAVSRSRS